MKTQEKPVSVEIFDCVFTPAFSRARKLGTNLPSSVRQVTNIPFDPDNTPEYVPPGQSLREALISGSANGSIHGYRSLESDGDEGFFVNPMADMRQDRFDRAETSMRLRVTAQAAALDPSDAQASDTSSETVSETSSPAINAPGSAEVTISQ